MDRTSDRGWGFADTRFTFDARGQLRLTGNRYPLCGGPLPAFPAFWREQMGTPLVPEDTHTPLEAPYVPPRRPCEALERALVARLGADAVSSEDQVRLRHGHGQTAAEIYALRYGRIERAPDLVVFPGSTDDVAAVVRACERHQAACIPFGGGTSVTRALELRADESRPVVSLDLGRMNRIRWIDPVDRLACIEAGAIGRSIALQLAEHGFVLGHEPDSVEFSTLGGWVATHASGMKKNRYGNIEDIVVDVEAVTHDGVVRHTHAQPRESVGADARRWMFGSEGTLGVVTAAIVRLHPQPEVQHYGSLVFPTFRRGIEFLYDVQRTGIVPASLRLVDNTQFRFAQAFKHEREPWRRHLSLAQRFYVERVKRIDLRQLAAATVVYEGTADEVRMQTRHIRNVAARHGGFEGGASSGAQGYGLTFGIAYIRDFAFEHWCFGDSFETSVSWSGAEALCRRVKERVRHEHARMRLPGKPFVTARISQVYPSGVCAYFYMSFLYRGVDDPPRVHAELEEAARDEILACGGSLSHHHGIGKLKAPWLARVASEAALTWRQKAKQALDPGNVFAAGNQGLLP